MRFKKKPVVIEAIKVIDVLNNASKDWKSLPSWIVNAYESGVVHFASDFVSIKTLEGTMVADKEDWIICGVKGELYPCKQDIFEMTYEVEQ